MRVYRQHFNTSELGSRHSDAITLRVSRYHYRYETPTPGGVMRDDITRSFHAIRRGIGITSNHGESLASGDNP
jgi:hypothetical protein